MKVLPELLKSVEFGGGGPKAFSIVMKIGTKLSNDDFESKVTPVVIRLFANPDRGIRVCLLDNLPLMIDRFTQRIVNDKIFPQVVGGFTDIAPIVREQTLKSVLVFVPKLSDRTINGELLRYLAKTANDEQPGIRTNTTICLGKIAKSLGVSSRTKVLIAAFSRSLRDPFVHARNASLLALAATVEHFTPEDVATRILPAICAVLLDKEKLVRDQAPKTMDIFMQRIRKAAAAMPDSVLPPPSATAGGDANGAARMSTPQPDAGNAGSNSSWAGWAISSFTNKLSAAAGEIEPGATGASLSATTPNASSATAQPSRPTMHSTASASTLHRQAVRSPSASQPMSRNSSSSNVGGDSFFADAADDADAAEDDAWGAMDDGFGDDGGDAWGDDGANNGDENADPFKAKKTTTTSTSTANSRSVSGSGGVQPFGDDDAEPDFAGWLAAQEAKKKSTIAGGAKTLPKGLSKTGTGSSSSSRVPSATRPAAKPAAKPAVKPAAKPVAKPVAKKINLAPKDDDDADGWGDGW